SVFDETTGNETANFNMGGLIRGFTNGVMQIKSGGKVTIYIPPSLGYGNRQSGSIPPNSNLIFTVELMDVQ
ncbi:MAG TPA: FKBP-type peptidyl-prolyl cis-trans isomerase, partial [Flavisolibacter sp.]|nr:FKBP-type peptidyl-prolyl cis-trans isomerase [Flavisolibacter sp.]